MRFTATISREFSGEKGDQVHQLNGVAAYFTVCHMYLASFFTWNTNDRS